MLTRASAPGLKPGTENTPMTVAFWRAAQIQNPGTEIQKSELPINGGKG
jgi:hypothetical protein